MDIGIFASVGQSTIQYNPTVRHGPDAQGRWSTGASIQCCIGRSTVLSPRSSTVLHSTPECTSVWNISSSSSSSFSFCLVDGSFCLPIQYTRARYPGPHSFLTYRNGHFCLSGIPTTIFTPSTPPTTRP